ncbi:DinB family protein [Salsipaludibacter albus]|uniref:DinB family protein n=1 Tax=Salsipaludibacter albus TaxID=2849650 RepID=UPI001EE423CC|nr:DinB family protein [Salsipaludibacter albus]MBY5161134.1 DinB family protein [Salsipaludibacter albus]
MSERDTFVLADVELARVVDRITDGQWDQQLPPEFPTLGDQTYTVREIVGYLAYDEAWVPAMVAGQRMEEVGADAFGEPIGGDLLGDDPATRYRELVDTSIEAITALDEEDLDRRVVHFTYGDHPAREAIAHLATFRGLRVHDLGRALGQDHPMSDELVTGLWEMLVPRFEEYRAAGVFGEPVEVGGDATLTARLLAATGRQP